MKLQIFGRIPSLKNQKHSMCLPIKGSKLSKYRSIVFVSATYRTWEKEQLEYLAQNYKVETPIERCSIVATLFRPDARKTDLINKMEGPLDLLVNAGILSDDNCEVVTSLTMVNGSIDRENPRLEIEIIEI